MLPLWRLSSMGWQCCPPYLFFVWHWGTLQQTCIIFTIFTTNFISKGRLLTFLPGFQMENLVIKSFVNNQSNQCFIQDHMDPSGNSKLRFYFLSLGSVILLALEKGSLNCIVCQRSTEEKSRKHMISPSQYGTVPKSSRDSVINLCSVIVLLKFIFITLWMCKTVYLKKYSLDSLRKQSLWVALKSGDEQWWEYLIQVINTWLIQSRM